MQRAARERRIWSSIHRWLGIGLGAWFALVGASGSVLVFEEPVDAWLNPSMLREPRPGDVLAPDAILDRALEEFPGARVERIHLPAERGEVYRVLLVPPVYTHPEVPRLAAMFSPSTGRLLGSRDAEKHGLDPAHLLKTLYDFHRNILLGTAGSNIAGIAGLLLLGSALTGLAVALPRTRSGWRRIVGIKLRASLTRVVFDVHRSTGMLIAVLLILATVTGSTLVYINYVRELVGIFSRVDPFPVIPWRVQPAGTWPEFAQVVRNAQAAHPSHAIAEIHIPARPTNGYLFYLRKEGDVHRLGDTILWIHPATGETLVERSSRNRTGGESVMHWLFPLHSGTAFGFWGMVAMCITGLAPLALVSTGVWVWLRKRRAAAFEAGRRMRSHAGRTEGFGSRRDRGAGSST